MSYLSDAQYNDFLEERFRCLKDSTAQAHTRKKLELWRRQYQVDRLVGRAAELLGSEEVRPNLLYLRCEADLQLLSLLVQRHRFNGRSFQGFLAADELRSLCKPASLSPFPVHWVSEWRDGTNALVLTLSDERPFRDNGRDRGNDYLERFIDLDRFQGLQETANADPDRITVLYPMYREIHTVSILAGCVGRMDERLRSISLSPSPLLDADFDVSLVEPFLYLWPLIFRMIDPALVHLNVGWGIQALALSALLPDRKRTVVDFYEVLSFLPDAFFERTHSSAEEVRQAEAHFFQNYDHIMHLCSEETSHRLAQKYGHSGSIVSVTEYLQEPTYCSPPRDDGEIRLVYGGAMLATNSPDDFYYRPFLDAARYYNRENLHLYIYNSPYLNGVGENHGLKDVVQSHGLTHVHVCKPLRLEEFTRQIVEYDYGIFLLTARDLNAGDSYNHMMATKFLTYLQAGLPVVIDAGYRYMADLVEQYDIGIVLRGGDLERLPEVLNQADLAQLKRNVEKFRSEFRLEKAGAKVLKLYHEILEQASLRTMRSITARRRHAPGRKPVSPEGDRTSLPGGEAECEASFANMIEVMARRENRLYYRDQSARTMSSLATLARRFDPSVIVELGTLGGLSLRTWIASTKQTRIHAVDLSFQTFHETQQFLPADLSRVTLLEQDILKTDFARLWTAQDRVIFFIDAHDLPNVPIMKYVLETALPSLPEGSLVIVDDLWFNEDRLTPDNARSFLEGRVLGEIDELQCFNGHFAPYHAGGSFMGFAEVLPLLEFVNEHGIPLMHDRGGKHAFFVWKRTYLSQHMESEGCRRPDRTYGSLQYNPLESVPVGDPHRGTMCRIAGQYLQKDIHGAAENLSNVLAQDPRDPGLSYGLAVCLARGGMLSQAHDLLARNLGDSSHPRYKRLFDDLARRIGAPRERDGDASQPPETPDASSACGITIFAMPKAFTGHTGTIQKNAIRSWARLDPAPEIILFGDEPGTHEIAEEIGAKHIAEIGRNEFGTPLVDKLFALAQDHASHPVLTYVNADVIFLQDFAQAVQKVQSDLASFLLIGRRWDLALLDEIDFTVPSWRESLSQQLAERGMLHAECGLDYFVFRPGLWPEIPPFAIGRTAWDNWLVIDPQRRGVPVVDGTEFVTAVHQDHDYAHIRGGRNEAWKGQEAVRNRSLAGTIDDSAYTTGAMWALDKQGQLIKAQPRESEFGTPAYRARRIAWLAKQAGWLTAHGAMELAACRWEEMLTILDKLAGSAGRGGAAAESLEGVRAAECYRTGCVSLAGCYRELGRPEQVVACYTRLLGAPWIKVSPAQRDGITRLRDRLLECLSQSGGHPDGSSAGGRSMPAASEAVTRTRQCPLEPKVERCKRLALVVSIPERHAGLRNVIRAMETQVDEIRILLNEYEVVPRDLYDWRKVSVVETSRTGELYASGVWRLLRPEDEGYVFILDDDIAYPADYAQRTVAKIEEHRRQAVVVVHGMHFCQPFKDYTWDRAVYRFEGARGQDVVVDAGGVGTLVFHTDTIRPQLDDFRNPNFRDLWFAILAARRKIPIVCMAREAHWLRTLDTPGKQLWHMSHKHEWKDQKNRVFREHLLPLLDTREQPERVRTRAFTIFCFTNGRSTFDYSARSVADSMELHHQIVILRDMHFLDAAAKSLELCTTPYFFKVDDDFLLHPQAIAYMRQKVLAYAQPEKLGIYYCHLWEDWTSRVRESIKVYNVEALREIGGFQADALGKVDQTTVARLEEAGFKVVADPSVVAVHACGDWREQLEYERLWSSMAGKSYRKPTHDAMKKYCGTKSLEEQYAMRLGFLEAVNRQLNTPFHQYLIDSGAPATAASAAGGEKTPSRAAWSVGKSAGTGGASPHETDKAASPADLPELSNDHGLTVFAMPKSFTGHRSTIQKNAIRSWVKLDPMPEIILFGDEPGIREMAAEAGARHIPEVARNEFGTPLVDKLFQAAQDLASHRVMAYVNADMILLQDSLQAVERVRARFPSFLLIGQRWDLPLLEEINFGDPQWRQWLQRQLQEHAMLHAECGLDYFIFRKGLWPRIPPFAIGRTAWDNWLVTAPRKRGVPVIDGTDYITAVHQDHDYGHVAGGRHEAWNGAEAARNYALAGPTDHFGLTTGATWLLREDGILEETPLRRPQYITARYRNQRSHWLLQQAKRLMAAGAKELAACKCEEALACLDGWLALRKAGCASSEPVEGVDIPSRYYLSYTLLAQCQTQMGCYEQAVQTCTQLLESPGLVTAPAQRNQILQVRDRLIRQGVAAGRPVDIPATRSFGDEGLRRALPTHSESSAVCSVSSGVACNTTAGRQSRVTIVTVCRNGERYLKECLESLQRQTMPDWELLLIDDGSTDASARMIDDLARQDARIKPHYFRDNRGPYVRRNFAIRRANSEFIVIQDVDDIMSPTKLEQLHDKIRRDNDLAMVGSYHRTFLEEFRGLEYAEPCDLPLDHKTIAASCASWRASISHGTAIIRKALFDTIGPYDENPFAADAFWSAKLALYAETGAPARMANLPEYLTFIRIHSGSQTQLLPVFDPRSRRVRYRLYCECKLRRVRENWRRRPGLDIAAELRHCNCSDFLTRFKAKIIQWESETLSARFLNDLLAGALSCFQREAYVSCVSILNGLEVMQRDIARRVAGFDLLQGMASHASGLSERGLIRVQQEIENHDNPVARSFLRDVQEHGPSVDVQSWYVQHAFGLKLRLAGEERERVRVALV